MVYSFSQCKQSIGYVVTKIWEGQVSSKGCSRNYQGGAAFLLVPSEGSERRSQRLECDPIHEYIVSHSKYRTRHYCLLGVATLTILPVGDSALRKAPVLFGK